MSIAGSLFVQWTDHQLTWDPATYGGLIYYNGIFKKNVWLPDIVVDNSITKREKLG